METIRITPICRINKLSERTTSNIGQVHSSSGPRVDRINMYFRFIHGMVRWSHDHVLIGRPILRPIVNFVPVIQPQVINSVLTHETIKTELSGWDLPDCLLAELIQRVISETSHMLESVSQGSNVLNVLVQVCIKEDHFMGVRQSGNGMVPVTESSIKSLKRKRVMDSEDGRSCESCPICWKEFSGGDEAVCTPCSHEFCGGCIEKWLRTNHNCPMCRYEMPKNVTSINDMNARGLIEYRPFSFLKTRGIRG